MNDIIKENLEKIQDISELKDDWNGNGASAFKDTLIQKMKYLILRLNVQPEIFPTARGSIQFEYEKETGEYLEFELFDTKLKVLTMGSVLIPFMCRTESTAPSDERKTRKNGSCGRRLSKRSQRLRL